MTTPPVTSPVPDPASLPYPEESDATIRRAAEFIGARGIVTLLDKLRVFIAGDIGKVLHLADTFAGQHALIAAVDQINSAQLALSEAWRGDAADQFALYAGMAKTTLNQNQNSMLTLIKTVSSIAGAIIDTYSKLITMIGKCAINISQLGGKIVLAIAETSVVPPIAPLKLQDIADALNSAFATFWQDCLNLLTGMMSTIGTLIGDRIDLTTIETNFATLPDLGGTTGVVDDPARWHVKPGASHP